MHVPWPPVAAESLLALKQHEGGESGHLVAFSQRAEAVRVHSCHLDVQIASLQFFCQSFQRLQICDGLAVHAPGSIPHHKRGPGREGRCQSTSPGERAAQLFTFVGAQRGSRSPPAPSLLPPQTGCKPPQTRRTVRGAMRHNTLQPFLPLTAVEGDPAASRLLLRGGAGPESRRQRVAAPSSPPQPELPPQTPRRTGLPLPHRPPIASSETD